MRVRLFLLPAVLLAGVLPGAAPGHGVTPHLVKDINPVPVAQGSSPREYATLGALAIFAADDGESGREIWRSDGTVAGTFQLADACPGECSGHLEVVARTGRSLFFRAFGRGFGPLDLWVTDGSRAGTVRLAGPLLLPESPRRSAWIASQGLLYFAADNLVNGMELWRSDGTAAGTFQVTDLRPGVGGSEPDELTEAGGRLFFRADRGEEPALWTSDGTAEGTRLVRQTGPALLRAVGRTLFFVAPVAAQLDGLWTSDGTPGGTSALRTFASTPAAPAFLDVTVLGDRLLFVAFDPVNGAELWASNGTRGGTRPLSRFAPGSPFLPLDNATVRLLPEASFGGRMVFRADDGVHGVEPWVTDGTVRGTRLLHDVCPGPCSGAAATDGAGIARLAAGERLFFSGDNGERGAELWATDGTEAGTRLVRDLCRGSCGSSPAVLNVGEGELFLLALNGQSVPQLWRSDGTSKGTVRLTSFQTQAALAGGATGAFLGDVFLFSAGDDHGQELWATDGTPQGTRLFLDINREDLGGSFPTAFRSASDRGFFFAQDGIHGSELWASDGTEAGTVLVDELFPGGEPAAPPEIRSSAESAGRLFFVARLPGESGFSLWRSAGTPGSTSRLTPESLRVLTLEPLRAIGAQVFFVAADADHGEELWTSDGTAEGTRMLADLEPGLQQGSQPRSLTVFGGRLYFTASVGEGGRELWRSDGTPGGTVLVKDVDPRPGRGSEPQNLTGHAGRLYFSAADEEHGLELWSTDGTAAGTVLTAELTPGPDGFFMTHLISAGSRLFLSGGPADFTKQGLYVSDGTAAGTRRINPVLIQIDAREIATPAVFNGRLLFASTGDQVLWASDGTEEGTDPLLNADGMEICEPESYRVLAGQLYFTTAQEGGLYQTDGTPPGTSRILELSAPAEAASFELVPAGPRLLFRKWDRLTGSELWALEAE
ncbi:MAG TPA: ELWxxDGT repeat protein [Thermoanaerobaculia bacterium]|nr:ELWxxDGT repeat protein [Thermoanaerobaculia bacterium]